jgi:vacuolar protein sorting-associated protein 13A/C
MEGILLRVLEKSLGKYVHGINKENLKVGVWAGKIEMRNISLREDALSELHLPVQVVRGSISHILLKVPWSKLTSEPVIVKITDVFLVALPTDTSNWTEKDYAEFAWRRKKDHIASEDEVMNKQLVSAIAKDHKGGDGKDDSNDKSSSSWAEGLVIKILSNLQVTIENVHVRYEHIPTPSHAPLPPKEARGFAFGLTINSLIAHSTNNNWEPSFDANTALSRKEVKMEGLSLYAQPHSFSWASTAVDDATFRSLMLQQHNHQQQLSHQLSFASPDGGGSGSAQFLLQPVGAR